MNVAKERKKAFSHYATVDSLAMDLGRYLEDKPVLARPPGQCYRLQKLVQRNRTVLPSTATALLMGALIPTMLLFRERDARLTETRLRQESALREKAARDAWLASQPKIQDTAALLSAAH